MKFLTQRKINGNRQKCYDNRLNSRIYYTPVLHITSTKKRIPSIIKRIKWGYLLIIFILCISLIFILDLFFGTKYKITKIGIKGNQLISTEEINEVIKVYKGQNFLLVFPSQIENLLKSKFFLFQNVYVTKTYPDILDIEIEEKSLKYFINCLDLNEVLTGQNDAVYKDETIINTEFENAQVPIITGQFNLNDIPLSSDIEIRKAKVLAIQDDITREEELAKIEKEANDFRISKYKLLLSTSYKSLENVLKKNDKIKNKYALPSLYCYDSKLLLNQNYLIKSLAVFDKFRTLPLELPLDSIIFINENKIIGISNEKVFIFTLLSGIEQQIERLNIVIKDFRIRNESFVQINVSGEKVIVL